MLTSVHYGSDTKAQQLQDCEASAVQQEHPAIDSMWAIVQLAAAKPLSAVGLAIMPIL